MANLDQLLKKEMTRRQFLLTLGGALVSLFGFSTLMGLLTRETPADTHGRPGYGEQYYGP